MLEYFNDGYDLVQDPSDPSIVYAVGSHTLDNKTRMAFCKSSDWGLTWPVQRDIWNEPSGCISFAVALSNSQYLYAGGKFMSAGIILISTNGGITWVDVTNNLYEFHSSIWDVKAIFVDPEDFRRVLIGTTGGVFKTTNAGSSWSATPLSYSVTDLAWEHNTGTIYAATPFLGLFCSTDFASTWQPLNEGLGCLEIECLAFDPVNRMLYAGTTRGACWRLSLERPQGVNCWMFF